MTKEERKQKAEEWVKRMESRFPEEIENSIKNSIVFDKNFKNFSFPSKRIINFYQGNIEEFITKSIDCISEYGILNFASYHYPGGGFINGHIAQEEALCHATSLYSVLNRLRDKVYNKRTAKAPFYNNEIIISPNIVCENEVGDWNTTTIITCAAPNLSREKFLPNNYEKIMRERIKLILKAFKYAGIKNPILGAFGCGVFKNPPELVAKLFKEEILKVFNEFNKPFDKIYFVIPEGSNFDAFYREFKDML